MTEHATIFSRRRILAALGLGGAAAAVSAAPPLPLSWTRKADGGSWWDRSRGSLERGAMEEWRSQVGTSFSVDGENGATSLKLVKVEPRNSKGRRPSSLGRDRAFAAVFEADGNAPAGDRTYALAYDGHGTVDVFMTGANRAGSKMVLEAVFN
jgi:hypothetical protein